MPRLTIPEQVDQAVTALIENRPAAVRAALAGEVEAARLIRDGLVPVPLSEHFEMELAWRLAHPGPLESLPLPLVVRHHWRWAVAATAVVAGSAAVGLASLVFILRRPGGS